MQEALAEVEEFCEKNSWINEIYAFCMEWNDESVLAWRGKAAFTIEVYVCVLIHCLISTPFFSLQMQKCITFYLSFYSPQLLIHVYTGRVSFEYSDILKEYIYNLRNISPLPFCPIKLPVYESCIGIMLEPNKLLHFEPCLDYSQEMKVGRYTSF